MQNYSSLQETHEPDEEAGGPLVHVAEPSRARWNHIEDLDSFFTRMYQYHQRHGFFCMLLQEILELVQFMFVVCLTAYILHGIDYPVLFNEPPKSNASKVTIRDVLYTPGECISHFTALTWIAIIIAMTVWSLKLIRGVYHLFYFWEIKQFYNTALKIEDGELDNLTWSMVQTKVRVAQMEQQMCIHKRDLSELDIYHRILRQQNYLIAMVNKKLLPPRLHLPFLGEIVYWTAGLRLNMQLLLFWSPWSPFEHSWQLREEYKKSNLRQELAYEFGKQILWLAAANFVFAPIIFLWQILHAFFSYAAIIRKEPSVLAIRRWSLYGRLYLRHFNELEHELQARLTRAYRPASKYLSAFSSPVGSIISESIGFFAAAFLAVLVGLSLWDEDVLTVEHLLTLMTALTVAVAVLRNPDETASQDLENLLTRVMYNTHYMPAQWQGQAHTQRVRKEIEQLFQYGFVSLLETILSPIVTPFILWWYVYPRALEFVDFFRCFTVSVVGVGDVCSFAQMDIQKNGNPDWHETSDMTSMMPEAAKPTEPEQYKQADDGKVEMSLMHFRSTNPSWKPPESVQAFVKNVQNQSSMIASLSNQDRLLDDSSLTPGMWRIGEPCNVDALNVDVPLYTSNVWRARAMSAEEPPHMSRMWTNEGISPSGIREMALNATYLHNLNSMKTENRTRNTAQETTPLLINR